MFLKIGAHKELCFNKFAGLIPSTLLKSRLWCRCVLVNFAKFLRTPFFYKKKVAASFETIVSAIVCCYFFIVSSITLINTFAVMITLSYVCFMFIIILGKIIKFVL